MSESLRMPVLFVGHGSPMNAIEENAWSKAWRDLGKQLPRPEAILSVSAHWYVGGTFLTANATPKTIHDFGGFPRALYEMQYSAPGDPHLARRTAALLEPYHAAPNEEWGLDHGTWTVLHHMYPHADVPVVQLSIDRHLDPDVCLEIGKALRPLREDGVLILGSGNIVHNLHDALLRYSRSESSTPEWATRFDSDAARAINERDWSFLARALDKPDGRMSHPTPDHYLPLLYVAGATSEDDRVNFPVQGFDLGSLSMRAVLWESSNDHSK
jgi:4,5-DOPA dioxygenase extradiol